MIGLPAQTGWDNGFVMTHQSQMSRIVAKGVEFSKVGG